MKKLVVMVLVIAMVLSIGMFSVSAAEPTVNGDVAGILDKTNAPNFTINLTGDYILHIEGTATGESGNYTYFNATCTGDINGTMIGTVNAGGLDTMFAEFVTIDGNPPSTPVSLVGVFLQSDIDGDFEGQIVIGDVPDPVNSLTIEAEGGVTKVAVGDTVQMTAVTDPTGDYAINWSIYVNNRENASIDQNGLVTGLKAGTAIVIANTVDPNVATDTYTLTVVEETEVTANIDPTYTIVIPAAVDFGTLIKDSGDQTQDFPVQATGLILESGYQVVVGVSSDLLMYDMDGTGVVDLPYELNNGSGPVSPPATFATFTGDDTEDGTVVVDTSLIEAAGSYKGTMDFTISYEAIP